MSERESGRQTAFIPRTLPASVQLPALRRRFLTGVLRSLLTEFRHLPAWLARPWAEVREAVAAVYRRHPGAVLGVLGLPCVHGPIQASLLAGVPAADGLLAAVPSLLAGLAERRLLADSGLRRGVFWGAPISSLLCPAAGAAWEAQTPAAGALFLDGEVDMGAAGALRLEGEPGERRFWPLAGGGWLAGADNNPLRAVEAHPDKAGSLLDMGGRAPEAWARQIDAARALVAEVLPELAAEHRAMLACVVPVGDHGERSLSASYRECVGQVYVSHLGSVLGLAESLIHETQHNFLNLLSLIEPVLLNPPDALYASPVRPDPRPIWGVLLAVHAFVPVELLYRRIAETGHPMAGSERFDLRYREIVQVNREGMEVLRMHARGAGAGAELLAELEASLSG